MKKLLNKVQVLSTFSLKIIAVITMLLDHIGVVFYEHLDQPVLMGLRIIGRLSFPIFAFLLVEGFIHTRDRLMYLARILGFGVGILAMQVVLQSVLGINIQTTNLNIFMTLGLGLIIIWFIEIYWETSPLITTIGVLSMTMMSDFVRVDYGAYGVLAIVFFYIFRASRNKQMLSFLLLTALYVFFDFIMVPNANLIQGYAVGVIPLLYMYNGMKGKYSAKYFFYFFYPLHLAVLYLIEVWFFA